LFSKEDSGGHALGIWRNNDGVYHFLDANYGWFRFDNVEKFKAWFPAYLELTGYQDSYDSYRISKFSLSNFSLSKSLANFFTGIGEFVKNFVESIFQLPASTTEVKPQPISAFDQEAEQAAAHLTEAHKKYVLSPDGREQIGSFERELSMNALALGTPEKISNSRRMDVWN